MEYLEHTPLTYTQFPTYHNILGFKVQGNTMFPKEWHS